MSCPGADQQYREEWTPLLADRNVWCVCVCVCVYDREMERLADHEHKHNAQCKTCISLFSHVLVNDGDSV